LLANERCPTQIQKLTEAGVVFKVSCVGAAVLRSVSIKPHLLCAVQHITHVPVRTSEEAAQIRGAPLHSGAKAMFMLDKRTEEVGVPNAIILWCVRCEMVFCVNRAS
jgi:hypothetical protein